MIRAVKAFGLETCATLGQPEDGQAQKLAAAVSTITTTTSIPRAHTTTTSCTRTHTMTD